MLKLALAGLLSAALIHMAPAQALTTQNHKAATNQNAGQRHSAILTAKATEPVTTTPAVATAQVQLSPHEDLMQQAGIPQEDWNAVNYIVSHESSWRPTASNTESGAYGLCQALPASKMATAGDDYMTNPVTQLQWCHDYANSRYGGWWNSFAFWKAQRWW